MTLNTNHIISNTVAHCKLKDNKGVNIYTNQERSCLETRTTLFTVGNNSAWSNCKLGSDSMYKHNISA